MTEAELREIEAREKAATKGPWGQERTHDDQFEIAPYDEALDGIKDWDSEVAMCFTASDATFVTHARMDVPRLTAEVRRLQEIIRQQEERGGDE